MFLIKFSIRKGLIIFFVYPLGEEIGDYKVAPNTNNYYVLQYRKISKD